MNCLIHAKIKLMVIFLKYIQRRYTYNILNIGTILNKVPEYSNMEQIFSAGIDDIVCDRYSDFKYTINDIPKGLIKLCKENRLVLSNGFLSNYKANPDGCQMAFSIKYNSLNKDDVYNILNAVRTKYIEQTHKYKIFTIFNALVFDYGYNAKSLLLYLDELKTYEALENMTNLMYDLFDYVVMMKEIGNKFDKYPKHFLTTHKIAVRNYNRLKQEFSEKIFKERINRDYECTFGDYIFRYPNCIQDIKDEAIAQNNCVASYIQRVINGECHILFLRKKDSPNESLVTIEVRNNQIIQARRRFNYLVTKEEQEVIDKWNEKFSKKQEKIA